MTRERGRMGRRASDFPAEFSGGISGRSGFFLLCAGRDNLGPPIKRGGGPGNSFESREMYIVQRGKILLPPLFIPIDGSTCRKVDRLAMDIRARVDLRIIRKIRGRNNS